jgi:hypothetical protein
VALTVRKITSYADGNHRKVIADVAFDNAYRTGGLALTARDLGMGLFLSSVDAQITTRGHGCPYDYTNSKLLAFNGTTQIADGTDLSGVTTRVTVIGKGYGL